MTSYPIVNHYIFSIVLIDNKENIWKGEAFLLRKWYQKKRYENRAQKGSNPSSSNIDANENSFKNQTDLGLIHEDLKANVEALKSVFQNCMDVTFHPFKMGNGKNAVLIYIDNMSNKEEMDKSILSPLTQRTEELDIDDQLAFFPVTNSILLDNLDDCIRDILIGQTILFIEGFTKAASIGLQKWDKRGIEEPQAQTIVRGPREGFIETLPTNLVMIRRKIKSPYLKFEHFRIGTFTRTSVILCYIEGIVEPSLVEEARRRLKKIKVDGVLESGYIEEFIEDNWMSPFPQVLDTERPDIVSANLLEGRMAILVDGTPFALIAPVSFFSLIQAPDDHYQRWFFATPVTWVRLLLTFISFLLPSLYVAILTYHQEMLPTSLVITIASLREAVPFPALVEVLLVEFMFEALREAGIRLPKQMGSAVSIVGALVIGEAAVRAGIISSPVVIIVSVTGIASFAMPAYSLALSFRILRFPFVILAGTLGFLGIMFGIIGLAIHLCSLRSFGLPYLAPIAPLEGKELKDTVIRTPWWMLKTRPRLTGEANLIRQGGYTKPKAEKGEKSNE